VPINGKGQTLRDYILINVAMPFVEGVYPRFGATFGVQEQSPLGERL
jgi:hypothetical protein